METKIIKQNNCHYKLGFTLIEIVIVIAIMAIMSTIVYSSFDTSKAKSRDQKRVSDISAIQLALEQYFQKYGIYPVNLTDLKMVPFISSIPKDPKTNMDYSGYYFPLTKDSDSASINCISYHLWTELELNEDFLKSKKAFDSSSANLKPVNSSGLYYKCNNNGNSGISVTQDSKFYDVMP